MSAWFPASCSGRSLVILFEQDSVDEADDGVLVGENADDLGAALDLAVALRAGPSP